MRSLVFAFCVVFAFGDLRAQTDVWQPSVGHVQIPIWPGTAPDAEPVPGPESYTTTTKLIAGKPAVVVNSVSQPTRGNKDAPHYWQTRWPESRKRETGK